MIGWFGEIYTCITVQSSISHCRTCGNEMTAVGPLIPFTSAVITTYRDRYFSGHYIQAVPPTSSTVTGTPGTALNFLAMDLVSRR